MKNILKKCFLGIEQKYLVWYINSHLAGCSVMGHQLSWQSNRLLICGSQVRSLHGSKGCLSCLDGLFFMVPIVQRQSARLWIWLSSVRSRLGTPRCREFFLCAFFLFLRLQLIWIEHRTSNPRVGGSNPLRRKRKLQKERRSL